MKWTVKRPTKRQVKKLIQYIFMILVGNLIIAAGPAFFIIPGGFAMGGTAGIGIFIRTLLPETIAWREWAVQLTVYAVNIILFLLGAILLGKTFALATLAGTLLYPTFLSLFEFLNAQYLSAHGGNTIVSNPVLAIILGALLYGFGSAIIFRMGICSGGTDIPPLILKKYFNTPIFASVWVIDLVIILLQIISLQITGAPIENALWGIVIAIISAVVVDVVSPIGMKRTQVKIISKRYREIREMILNQLNRGVTTLIGQTGYLKEKCFVLLTVVSNRELVKLKNEVQKIDPEAFLMVSVISEVRGRGFSSAGIKLPKEAEVEDIEETENSETAAEFSLGQNEKNPLQQG